MLMFLESKNSQINNILAVMFLISRNPLKSPFPERRKYSKETK